MTLLWGLAGLFALYLGVYVASHRLRLHAQRTGRWVALAAARILVSLPSLILAGFAFEGPVQKVLAVLAAGAWHGYRLREELVAWTSADAVRSRLFPASEAALWSGTFAVGEREVRVELGGLAEDAGQPHWIRAALGQAPCAPPGMAAGGAPPDSLGGRVWFAGDVPRLLSANRWIFVHEGAVQGRLPAAELATILEERAKALAAVAAAMEDSASEAPRRFAEIARGNGSGRRQAWLDLDALFPEALREVAGEGIADRDDTIAAIAAVSLGDEERVASLLERSVDLGALERLTRWGGGGSRLATVALRRAAREQGGLGPELVAFAAAALAVPEPAAIEALLVLVEDPVVSSEVVAPARALLAKLREAHRQGTRGGLALTGGGEVSAASGGEVSVARARDLDR